MSFIHKYSLSKVKPNRDALAALSSHSDSKKKAFEYMAMQWFPVRHMISDQPD